MGAGKNKEGGQCGQGSPVSVHGLLRSQGPQFPQLGEGEVRWLPPERALGCAVCIRLGHNSDTGAGGVKEEGSRRLSLSPGSARILSAGLSFLRGMEPRLGPGRER